MISVLVRRDMGRLRRYFHSDFESPSWDVEAPEKTSCNPSMRVFIPGNRESIEWMRMNETIFDANIPNPKIRKLKAKGKGEAVNYCRLELGFAPPKSVSLIAFLSGNINYGVVNAHHSAIDDTFMLIERLFVERTTRKNLLIPKLVHLLRFTHSQSHLNDPQLHSHVIVTWPAKERALHSYPFTVLQRFISDIYGYCLAFRINQLGWEISAKGEISKQWEVSDIPEDLIKVFSKRSEEILGMEDSVSFDRGYSKRRNAQKRLSSPPTHKLPLSALMDIWQKQKFDRSILLPKTISARDSVGFVVPPYPLERYFSESSIACDITLLARVMKSMLGVFVAPEVIVSGLKDVANKNIQNGALVLYNGFYCHRESFYREQEVLKAMSSGVGKGVPYTACAEVSKRGIVSRLKKPDKIKVIAVDSCRDIGTLEQRGAVVVSMDRWNTTEVYKVIKQKPNQELIFIVPQRPKVGEFLRLAESICSAVPASSLVRGKTFLVNTAIEFSSEKIEDNGARLMRSRKTVVVVPSLHRSAADVQALDAALHKRVTSQLSVPKVILYRPVPWSDVQILAERRLVQLFSAKNSGVLRHGRIAKCEVVFPNGNIQIRCGGYRREIEKGDLEKARNFLVPVVEFETSLGIGSQIMALADFREDKGSHPVRIEFGDLLRVRLLKPDSSICGFNGDFIPWKFKIFQPLYCASIWQVMKMQPNVVILEDFDAYMAKDSDESLLGLLRTLAVSCSQIVIHSSGSLERCKEKVGQLLHSHLTGMALQKAALDSTSEEMSDFETPYFPSRDCLRREMERTGKRIHTINLDDPYWVDFFTTRQRRLLRRRQAFTIERDLDSNVLEMH